MMEQGLFIYDENDFLFDVKEGSHGSRFDDELQCKWNLKMNEEKVFWYELNIQHERTISNKFLLQLNINRALLRRPPATSNSVNEPFNPERFNFNKIKSCEKLFCIYNRNCNNQGLSRNVIAINVSPLEFGHVLLIPNPEKCYPQMLTTEALKTVLEFCLLSGSKYFRVGFNSLGAYASVNHLHFHGYYLKRKMFLENAPVEKISYACYKTIDYPAQGFVYQVRNKEELTGAVSNVFSLVQLMQNKNVPHNLYITRGLDFESSLLTNNDLQYNCLRIYVWARKPSWGSKEVSAFNIATCELFGHMVIKNENDYQTLTEDSIIAVLQEITAASFENIIHEFIELYQCL